MNKLTAMWKDGDMQYGFPNNSEDALFVETALMEELEKRGYDLRTLKFEIELQKEDYIPPYNEYIRKDKEQTLISCSDFKVVME